MAPSSNGLIRCLHRSSIVIGIVALTGVLLVMLPGQTDSAQSDPLTDYAHGWPLVFLHRHVDKATIDGNDSPAAFYCTYVCAWSYRGPPTGPAWSYWDNWRGWRATESRFYPFHLVVDLLIWLLFAGLIAATWEMRRRRRTRVVQFTSFDLLLSVGLLAATLGWFRYLADQQSQEQEIVAKVDPSGTSCDVLCREQNVAPEWLKRLVGTDWLDPCFTRVHEVRLSDEQCLRSDPELAASLAQFEWLHTLVFDIDNLDIVRPEDGSIQFAQYAPLRNVRVVELNQNASEPVDFIDDEITQLATFQHIQEIRITDSYTLSSEQRDVIQERLPKCRITILEEGDW